jgi:hypothetical protein
LDESLTLLEITRTFGARSHEQVSSTAATNAGLAQRPNSQFANLLKMRGLRTAGVGQAVKGVTADHHKIANYCNASASSTRTKAADKAGKQLKNNDIGS